MLKSKKKLPIALSAALLSSVAATAVADVNPFETNPLASGYDVVQKGEAEGKCGEGKCGEGKCGEKKADKKADKEGKCGEGKCGEGKCGAK